MQNKTNHYQVTGGSGGGKQVFQKPILYFPDEKISHD